MTRLSCFQAKCQTTPLGGGISQALFCSAAVVQTVQGDVSFCLLTSWRLSRRSSVEEPCTYLSDINQQFSLSCDFSPDFALFNAPPFKATESGVNLSNLFTWGQSICQQPNTPSAVMMTLVGRRPLAAAAAHRIEPQLSQALTESMNHDYWSCCLLPGAQQTCTNRRAKVARWRGPHAPTQPHTHISVN